MDKTEERMCRYLPMGQASKFEHEVATCAGK